MIIAAALVFTAIMLYRRADARKKTVTELKGKVTTLEASDASLRTLVLAVYHDAVRHEGDAPMLAREIETRVSTHPQFKELLKEDLG